MQTWLIVLISLLILLFLLTFIIIIISIFKEKYQDLNYNDIQGVIVEMRNHPSLPLVLKNFADTFPTIPITIVFGLKNKDFVLNSLPHINVKLLELNAENLDSVTYSKLLTSTEFWNNIGNRKKTIIFQTDSGIIGSPSELKNFIEYDYCGAPWKRLKGRKLKQHRKELGIDRDGWHTKGTVGNGGFSIRDTAIARKHAFLYGPIDSVPEDVVFAKLCEEDPDCNICPVRVAKKFAVENTPDKNAWAFHKNYNKPLNKFNRKVLKLNEKAKPLGDVPDSFEWNPRLKYQILHRLP